MNLVIQADIRGPRPSAATHTPRLLLPGCEPLRLASIGAEGRLRRQPVSHQRRQLGGHVVGLGGAHVEELLQVETPRLNLGPQQK